MNKNFPIQMLQDGGAVRAYRRERSSLASEHPNWTTEETASGATNRLRRAARAKRRRAEATGTPGHSPTLTEEVGPPAPVRMQQGGEAEGNTDTVPIMATPGEHVMNRGAVAIAGRPYLDYLNAIGMQHPAMQPAKHLRPKKRQSEG